jgi:hypothetical protein
VKQAGLACCSIIVVPRRRSLGGGCFLDERRIAQGAGIWIEGRFRNEARGRNIKLRWPVLFSLAEGTTAYAA